MKMMDAWRLIVDGVGPHHNEPGDDVGDANKVGEQLLRSLEGHGHTIKRAQFRSGEGSPYANLRPGIQPLPVEEPTAESAEDDS